VSDVPDARAASDRQWRRGLLVVVLLTVLATLVLCLSGPVIGFIGLWQRYHPDPQTGPILRASALQRYPEYQLRYPAAVLIGEGGKDAENGPFFYSRAMAGAVLGTDDSEEQVVAFYERELAARGWQLSDRDTVGTTAELNAYAWRKGSVVFRLAFLRKNDPRNPPAGDQYATPFDFRLSADDPRDPRWTASPTPTRPGLKPGQT
jgi:hypothetical protein